MLNNNINAWVAVISHRRPGNIVKIQQVLGTIVTFYVNKGCADEYWDAGALAVVECGHDICAAHNQATIDAYNHGVPSWHCSDDLKKLTRVRHNPAGERVLTPVTFEALAAEMLREMAACSALYAGVAVNSNPLNYTGVDYNYDKLIVNDLFCLWPQAGGLEDVLFDSAVVLKEDYDMCIRQLIAGRPILRANNILCDFPHRQNTGGANLYRNLETEAAATQALSNKWGGLIKQHPTRAGQIALNYKAIASYRHGQNKTLF